MFRNELTIIVPCNYECTSISAFSEAPRSSSGTPVKVLRSCLGHPVEVVRTALIGETFGH